MTAAGSTRRAVPDAAPPLGTPRGERTIRVSLGLTVAGSAAWAVALVALARLVVAGPDAALAALALAGGLAGAAASVGALALSRNAAHAEEAPLREALLRRGWSVLRGGRDAEASGALVGLMTDSVERVATFRQTFLGTMVGALLAPLAVLAVLAALVDPLSAGLLAIGVALAPALVAGFHRAFRRVSTASRQARTRLAALYLESIQGLETLVALRAAPRMAGELARAGEENRRATMRLLAGNQVVLLVTDAVFSLGLITASAALARWRLDTGALDPAGALALVLGSILLVAPLDLVGSFFYVGMSGLASQRRIRGFLARPVAPVAAPVAAAPVADASASAHRPAATVVARAAGARLVHPSRRPGGEAWALDGLDLEVRAGDRIVLTGPSGAGKSTLLAALAGDLVPVGGEVVVDGIPLTGATQDAVRARSAVVAQSTWLFTGTIADNLRLVRHDAPDADLADVLARVGLDDFVRSAPDGLATVVGERGLAVSGGQAQRIALARALLSGRRLLLLDEPTAQVDLDSEQVILGVLDALPADHTVVLVTHRASATLAGARAWTLDASGLREGRHG